MSDKETKAPAPQEEQEKRPGFCSASCVDQQCFQSVIEKPLPKTSDLFMTCNLPKRFEHPHWFNGYGSQTDKQHPLYRTTSSDYGWYAPGYAEIPHAFHPRNQKFTAEMMVGGMYRNYSLNSFVDQRIHSVPNVFYPAGQTFTNHLLAAGMYRNYSLNTGMDPVGYQ